MSLAANPLPLGQLKPGADFATKSVPITKNIADSVPLSGMAQDVVIRAWKDNGANIFIVSDGNPPAADYSNVIDEIEPGGAWPAGSRAGTVGTVELRHVNVATLNELDFAFGAVRLG
jgi:hypothetical protein